MPGLIKIAFTKRKRVEVYSMSMPPGMPPGPPGAPPFGLELEITSSMRRIMLADSAADLMACSLTTMGSMTPLSMLFWILPVNTLMPWYLESALS